ncbi:hypothetical protein ACFQ14_15165 [Pseudahrensia aquimaris]|uniref:Uncharacterized protein n=1 Tax=Pseudahrensia aquimaris TaxID=744461 RepID=A0ABW3FNM2_9HYPH
MIAHPLFHYLGGLVFGIALSAVMLLPQPDIFVLGNTINLTVMTSLWLGALLVQPVERNVLLQEVSVGLLSLVVIALVFQLHVYLLIVGFVVQAQWSKMHDGGKWGVAVRHWYPLFSSATCLGMAVVVFIRMVVAL